MLQPIFDSFCILSEPRTTLPESKKLRALKLLALKVAAYLDWNIAELLKRYWYFSLLKSSIYAWRYSQLHSIALRDLPYKIMSPVCVLDVPSDCSYFPSRTHYGWHELFFEPIKCKNKTKTTKDKQFNAIKTWRHKRFLSGTPLVPIQIFRTP